MTIIVKKDFTEKDIREARLAGAEYRKNKSTSKAAHVLSMTDLKRSVILCDQDQRKFEGQHPYRLHPAHSRVTGRCDYCNEFGAAWLYLCEEDWLEQVKLHEKFKRALEYATIVS